MKKLLALFLLLPLSFICDASTLQSDEPARPWTFWYWMYGAVSAEGIRADLKAMKDAGLEGCYLMPIRGNQERPEHGGEAQQLSETFWKMVDLALQQADSLGLKMGIHICDGFALAGGPWITPEESMQKVIWADTLVVVGKRGQAAVALPPVKGHDGFFRDIATFAVSAEEPLPEPIITGTIAQDEGGTFRSREPGYIEFSYDEAQTVRSLEVIPSGNNLQAQRLLVQASDDGILFRNVRQLIPPRQGWQNTDCNYTFSLPETTATHFRFTWTPEGTEPGSEDLDAGKWAPTLKIKELRLSADPRIDLYEGKSGAVWRIAPRDTSAAVSANRRLPQVIPLTEGTRLPPGRWRILRFAHTYTAHSNATGGGAKGLECDKFSAQAVGKQLDNWYALFKQRPNSHVITCMHVDSWECGSQNWSAAFPDEFQKRRGYDLLPFMPVFAGIPMENDEQVLADIRQTIGDLLNDVFFTTVSARARRYGVQLSAESVAPTMVSDGMAHYRYADVPMGEFWLHSPTHDKPNDMLDAISSAHVYGKNIVQAEAFTEVRGVWNETPAMLKPLLDRQFALGVNRLFFHVFTHNPWPGRRPGMTLDGIGLFFQRDQTWFPEARALTDYITRCSQLLQKGRPVADIAVYTGEEMPRRALTPDRLVPMLPGLFGADRVASERRRLENAGCPMEESPVGVRHSAGILDLKDWVNALHGYQYDSMNPDALLQPFTHRLLVVPENAVVGPTARARIEELKRQGVAVIDRPFQGEDLSSFGIERDVILPENMAYTHRHNGEFGEIYFLSNQEARERTVTVSFRAGAYSDVAIYNPLTDRYTVIDGCPVNNPRTELSLTFPAYGSLFVCLSSGVDYRGADHRPVPVTTCLHQRRPTDNVSWKLTGGWDITFRENGLTLHTDTLFDWSRHPADSIRYFSGHARYATTLKIKGRPASTVLRLGTVCDVAHVWVNGTDCGILWTDPFEVDITPALRKGKNRLEIEVVNTWHNALRGADTGHAPFGGIWTNATYRTKGDALISAGLLGPLQITSPATLP